jgi:hypothetical protein
MTDLLDWASHLRERNAARLGKTLFHFFWIFCLETSGMAVSEIATPVPVGLPGTVGWSMDS